MAINRSDEPTLRALSRSEVENTIAGLKSFIKKSMWIGKTNRYAKDVVNRLGTDHPLNPDRRRNLAQYISASAVLHSNDGWSYLGRSIACLLSGDAHRALHFAYYAELRAAMSILAATGVGVFNHDHFVVTRANTTAKLASRNGTHVLAWDALAFWCEQPASSALFAKLIRPAGRGLDEWFDGRGGIAALAPQARRWLTQWGLDLRNASLDRTARNESSYRPDGLPQVWTLNSEAALKFVLELWALLEPSTGSPFDNLDRHILRFAIEKHIQGRVGHNPVTANPAKQNFVNGVVADQDFSPAATKLWADFLQRQSIPTDPGIFTMAQVAPNGTASDAFSVTARATLLLRIATGSAQNLLQQAGYSAADLSFWWLSVGEARGLWDAGFAPTDLTDLWDDISQTLSDLSRGTPPAARSANEILKETGDRFNILCSYERVGLWSVCPS